jgi:hypothetical protein
MKFWLLTLLSLLSLLPMAGPARADVIGQAQQAVEAHPNRPGLRLVYARALLRGGALEAAARQAQAVLDKWPRSTRARLLLAQIARARGDLPTARTHTEALAGNDSAIARAFVAPAPRSGRGVLWGRIGMQSDSRASPVTAVFNAPSRFGDGRALRARLNLGGGWTERHWRFRAGLDRTVHIAVRTDQPVADLDRTGLWTTADWTQGLAGGRLTAGVFVRGALLGRASEGKYLAGGGVASWTWIGPVAPWIRVEALGLSQGELDALAWTRGTAGVDTQVGPLTLRFSGAGTWLGPGAPGFRELEGETRVGLRCDALCPFLGGAAAVRDDELGLRPRAYAGLKVRLGRSWAVIADGGWQKIEADQRWLAGLSVEAWR